MAALSIHSAQSRPAYSTDEERWTALCIRDRAADGRFIYAVGTTGVYCRPSCAARRPLRHNVSFYPDPASAEAAGFRACRRCKPADVPAEQRHADLVAAACRQIEDAFETPTLDELAVSAGLSPFHFHRLFKRITGMTPRAYATAKKAARVRRELGSGQDVTHAIYAAGYGSASRFYEGAQARLGMSPTRYRTGGQHERIRFAVGECSLGHIIVAATAQGICEVRFGDDPQVLLADLQERFSQAELIGDEEGFNHIVQMVISHIERPGQTSEELPLDIRGTIFQQRVWEALRTVPVGKTATYADIARRIGQPEATRAVSQACGANRIAVLIPCHRVVRTDGSAGGYRWGIERKQELLKREARSS